MIEKTGDFWREHGDAFVITTNGTIKTSGACVMGRGIALEAKNRFPGIDKTLGREISNHGNRVHALGTWTDAALKRYLMYSFPVKHDWFEVADPILIANSASRLVLETHLCDKIVIVRPGCGNGQLEWGDVKPILKEFFDDRFIVIERKQNVR